ncbi:hypothetical protein C8Q80DRAFT_1097736, partial [Daedaleopsis nitida]
YYKAASAELSKEYDKAFRLYINAAEQFLHLSRQTTNEKLRLVYKGEAAKAVERAEKIKAVKQDIQPIAKDAFSEGEQLYVLQKSSLVNGGFFPLWDSPDKPSSSTEQPPLSAEQIEHGATWRKASSSSSSSSSIGDASNGLEPEDIVQHIVSDCSVCGSMVVAIDHHRRFGSKMILSSLFPQDEHDGLSRSSDTYQYQFKIRYNGASRRIDDQLPAYPDGQLMCVSTGEKRQLWPSLVEKTYMKLAGGYDFVGSDSSTDLHALAGWIPEILDMKGSNFQREKTWDRLIKGYTNGHCVATLGTGESIHGTDQPLALLPAHCYAIIGAFDTEAERGLTIFDPWVHPDHEEGGEEPVSRRESKPPLTIFYTTIDLSMDAIYSMFDGLYLSWDPAIFNHKLTFHGRVSNPSWTTHFRTQVQLDLASVDIREGEEVWVLLTRHVRSHRTKDEYVALAVHSGSELGSSSTNDILSTKGEYTNSPHVLVRTAVSHSEDLFTLVSSYEGERADVGFTLTVYCNCKASWVHIPQKLLHSKEVEGAFTQKTAGGNHTYPTYYLNPQYYLRVHPRTNPGARGGSGIRETKATLSVSIATDRHIPVNTMLAWSQGARINELGHNDLALSSGPYNYGYAHATGPIPPGDYTLVVSAFEPRHIGKFNLRVECSERFDLTPILQEGAGMFDKVVRGQWTSDTAGGGPSSSRYTSNPIYELQVPSTAQLKLRLQLAESEPSIALNLTLFNATTGSSGTLGRHIATSGPYSDAISGVLIDKVSLQPGRYLIVPSTYKPGVLASFKLIMYSTVSGVQLSPTKR